MRSLSRPSKEQSIAFWEQLLKTSLGCLGKMTEIEQTNKPTELFRWYLELVYPEGREGCRTKWEAPGRGMKMALVQMRSFVMLQHRRLVWLDTELG